MRPIALRGPRAETAALVLFVVATLLCCHPRTEKTPLTGRPEWAKANVSTGMLEAVDGTGPDDVWAVGYGVYHFNGIAWSTALHGGRYGGVSAEAPDNVWVVGVAGSYAHFDGKSWQRGQLDIARIDPTGLVKGYYDLIGVHAWPGEVWVTNSSRDWYRFDGKTWGVGHVGGTTPLSLQQLWGTSPRDVWSHALHFDGTSWTRLIPPSTARIVRGSASDDVWCAGWKGSDHDDKGALSHFDGKRWSSVPVPGGAPLLMSVSAVSRTEAYAVGQHGWALRWDGKTWRPSPTGVADTLTDVYAAGHGVAFAVGYEIGVGGYVLRTR